MKETTGKVPFHWELISLTITTFPVITQAVSSVAGAVIASRRVMAEMLTGSIILVAFINICQSVVTRGDHVSFGSAHLYTRDYPT